MNENMFASPVLGAQEGVMRMMQVRIRCAHFPISTQYVGIQVVQFLGCCSLRAALVWWWPPC